MTNSRHDAREKKVLQKETMKHIRNNTEEKKRFCGRKNEKKSIKLNKICNSNTRTVSEMLS